jgi:hypothetical protein
MPNDNSAPNLGVRPQIRMPRFTQSPMLWSIVGVWLALTLLILWAGLRAGTSSGGEVAFQMFLLGFPSSLAVSALLNALDYPLRLLPPGLHALEVWTPFFLAGAFQIGILAWAANLY